MQRMMQHRFDEPTASVVWTRFLFIAVMAIGLTCCVSSNFVRIGDKTFAPKVKDSIIDVYVSDEEPVEVLQALPDGKPIAALPKGSVKIARVDTNGAPAAEWIAVINDAKMKARMVGGDAIVISRWGSPVVAESYGQPMYGKQISFTVVRYPQAQSNDGN